MVCSRLYLLYVGIRTWYIWWSGNTVDVGIQPIEVLHRLSNLSLIAQTLSQPYEHIQSHNPPPLYTHIPWFYCIKLLLLPSLFHPLFHSSHFAFRPYSFNLGSLGFGCLRSSRDNFSSGLHLALKVFNRLLQSILNTNLWFPINLALGRTNVRLALCRIIRHLG